MKRITFFTSKSGLIFFCLAGRICSCSCSSRVAASAASGRPLSHKSRWPGAGASSPVLTVMRRPLSLIESASVGYSCPPSDTHWLCDCLSACTRCAFIRPPLLLRLSHWGGLVRCCLDFCKGGGPARLARWTNHRRALIVGPGQFRGAVLGCA